MSTIKTQFNYKLDQYSPDKEEYTRVVKYDDKGHEEVVYEKTDLPAITKSLGTASDWSLNHLLKAGINPDFGIHTAAPSRIESANKLSEIEASVDAFLYELDKTE